jgi:hypothetical protein
MRFLASNEKGDGFGITFRLRSRSRGNEKNVAPPFVGGRKR